MKSIQKFIVAAALLAMLAIGAASVSNSASQQGKDQASSFVLARHVNEYEGQHR